MNLELLKDKALLSFLFDTVWLMEPTALERMSDIVFRHAEGVKLSAEDIQQIVALRGDDDDETDQYRVSGQTAIIPIRGVIAKYASQVNGISQPRGTSCEQITADLERALADRQVERIVLHIESPGGSINGVAELADRIAAANRQKPVSAFGDGQAASAAYWLGSQAGKFYADRTAVIGSIGVYTVVRDSSAAAARAGYKYTIVGSGQFKGVGQPGTEITKDRLADLKNGITAIHNVFVGDVAAGRGMGVDELRPLADGRTFIGQQAVDAALIDGITTLAELLNTDVNNQSAVARASELGPAAASTNHELEGDINMSNNNTNYSAADVEKARQEAASQALTANQQRVQAVTKVLAGHPDLLAKALADPACDATAATALLVPQLQARIAELEAQLKDRDDRLAQIAGSGNDAAAATESDAETIQPPQGQKQAQAQGKNTAEAYQAAVQKHLAAGKDLAKAMQVAGNELPDAHAAWIEAGCPDI